MDKSTVVCTHNGMLFSIQKEGNSDTCIHLENIVLNKPDTKEQIL